MHVCNSFDRCINFPINFLRKLYIFSFRCSQHSLQSCPSRESRFCNSGFDFNQNVRSSFHKHILSLPAKSQKYTSYRCKHVRLRKWNLTKCIRIHMKSIASINITKTHQSSNYLRILIIGWCGSCHVDRAGAETLTFASVWRGLGHGP